MSHIVFVLMVVFQVSEQPTEVGIYRDEATCHAAAWAYVHAECKPVSADMPLYGTCWDCMHGCTRQQNIDKCGLDPLPDADGERR